MATWVAYNMPDCKSGDTFNGVQFDVIVNGAPANLAGSTISLIFENVPDTLTTSNGSIIISGITGRFLIPAQIINLPAGKRKYRIKITFADGRIKTYIRGTWNIL